jgi:hypothetical protein
MIYVLSNPASSDPAGSARVVRFPARALASRPSETPTSRPGSEVPDARLPRLIAIYRAWEEDVGFDERGGASDANVIKLLKSLASALGPRI